MQKKIVILFSIFLTSCSFFTSDVQKFKKTEVPKYFNEYLNKKDDERKWWEQLENSELNSLIEKSIENNFSLQAGVARLKQAYFSFVKTSGEHYPNLNLTASKTRTEKNAKNSAAIVTNDYSIGLSMSYEIDLWGRISNEKKSSMLSLKASKEELDTLASTVASQIAETWINIISIRKQKALLYSQLEINKKMLKIIELKLVQAKATIIEFYQQQQVIASIENKIIPVESTEITLLNSLNVLLGLSPNLKINIDEQEFPTIIEIPKTGLEANLIHLRPDIKSAELKLKAGGFNILVAKKNRFPKLSLTGTYTYSNSDNSKIFDDWISNLIANITVPIFAGKQLQAEQKRVEAVREELFMGYKETVITALEEVENYLTKEMEYKKKIKALDKQIEIAKKTFKETKKRYFNGSNTFLSVLNAELAIVDYEQSKIVASANMLTSRIKLYKALGSKIPLTTTN